MATNQKLKQELNEKQFFKNWDRSLESLKEQVDLYKAEGKPVPLWLHVAYERKELQRASQGSGPDIDTIIQAINDGLIINLSAHQEKYGQGLLEKYGKDLLTILIYEKHGQVGAIIENPDGFFPNPVELRTFKHDITVQILVNGDDVERSRLSGLLKTGYLPEDISNEIVSLVLQDWLCDKHDIKGTIAALNFLIENNAIDPNSDSVDFPGSDPLSSGTLTQAINHAIHQLREEQVPEETIRFVTEANDRYSKMAEQ